ncbi:MAG: pyruvate, phosphate dikinase/phosphoenolpyruvate synthase regulator [Acidimicrobiia bacterium]|nr:pyruvate, phosphate dikinase/phosphoenolpyruvate synthase regulator [Acidimicrobiia bacterium]
MPVDNDRDHERVIFCVSDHTGLTAEAYAHGIISQFDKITPIYRSRPFSDNADKVAAVVTEVNRVAESGARPVVFSTFGDRTLQEQLDGSHGFVIGLFNHWMDSLSEVLDAKPSRQVGRSHGIVDTVQYQLRLDAVDFALQTDDGLGTDHYGRADVILVGVSRAGKTPTSLYLAMHYAIRAANFPLSPDDHSESGLPTLLQPFGDRLFGLTIEPRRLHAIRTQRRPDSPYAELEVCRSELAYTERLFRAEGIPVIDTTTRSIEEISTTIIKQAGLERRA